MYIDWLSCARIPTNERVANQIRHADDATRGYTSPHTSSPSNPRSRPALLPFLVTLLRRQPLRRPLILQFAAVSAYKMGLYAIKGLTYFLGHPTLWKQSALALLLTAIVSTAAALLLFLWTLHPQELWLVDRGLPSLLAWILAVFVVLVEIFAVTLVYGFVLLEVTKDKIFAYVLEDKGYGSVIENRPVSILSSAASYCQVDVLLRFLLFVVSLPLNLIPIIGSLLFAWIHSTLIAWDYHVYYFELKAWRYPQQKAWILSHKVKYSSFGLQATLLHMIPFVGPFFVFSNAAGAALLAIKMEKKLAKGDANYQPFQPAIELSERDPLVVKGSYGTDAV